MIIGINASSPVSSGSGPAPDLPTVIGEAFGGGWYIGDIDVAGSYYKIIVAPKSGEADGLRWKTASTSTAGTSSLADGFSNTAAMNSPEHEAASHCIAFSGGGYTDWYMPALDELALFQANLNPSTTLIDEFKTGGSDQLQIGPYYWASTQSSATSAWVKRFGSTFQYGSNKVNTIHPVRPVRRLAFTP